jgi:hypothetical protein
VKTSEIEKLTGTPGTLEHRRTTDQRDGASAQNCTAGGIAHNLGCRDGSTTQPAHSTPVHRDAR